MNLRVVYLCLILLPGVSINTDEQVEDSSLHVKTTSGEIEGLAVYSASGKRVHAFLGIPYAAPPVGVLRFRPPVDVSHWEGIFQAKNKPVSCYQAEDEDSKLSETIWWISSATESENCLFLNIWVPSYKHSSASVLVWIHGGSFLHGSSSIDNYDGRDLASEEGIIVINLNYRLSAFGFLYLDSPNAPGNVGIMDQEMALKWLKRNIAEFGGDPNKITLMGHSAGAASAGFHFFSSKRSDLLKNVILAGVSHVGYLPQNKEYNLRISKAFAEELGCPFSLDDKRRVLDCLYTKDPESIMKTSVFLSQKGIYFYPLLDGKYFEEHEFVYESCGDRAAMVINTREEGASFMFSDISDRELTEETRITIEDHEDLIKAYLKHPSVPVVEVIKHFYSAQNVFNDPNVTRQLVLQFATDVLFLCSSVDLLNSLASKGYAAYQMVFSHEEFGTNLFPSWAGTHHGEELRFLFGKTLNASGNFSTQEIMLSGRTMRYIANFVKNSDPNSAKDAEDLSLPHWPAYTFDGRAYLHLNTDPSIEYQLRSRACSLFKALPQFEEALQRDRQ